MNLGKITIQEIEAFNILVPECLANEEINNEVFGRIKEWILVELIVASSFTFTMLILVIKSRFINIGID